ncbi:MAG: T9SS type A sorting domain-containing protein [Bacteroidales bacterium]|nr:T9SS type A sorting domain-containing protein [Bacteroidales bacterium]
MKKSLLSALMGLMATVSIAQSYQPMVKEGRYWDVADYSEWATCNYENMLRYYFAGDTTIDGSVYKKVYQHFFLSGSTSGFCPPFEIQTESVLNPVYMMYEDTLARKVYIRVEGHCLTEADLMYDFSLESGDTLHSNYAGQGMTLIVASTEYITLNNGKEVKKVNLDNGQYYIEGIGGSCGIFNPMVEGVDYWSVAACVKENNEVTFGNDCGNYFVGISQTEQTRLADLQTIIRGRTLEIISSKKLTSGEIQLFDIQGRMLLKRHTYASNTIRIELPATLPFGMFFIRFQNPEVQYKTKVLLQ